MWNAAWINKKISIVNQYSNLKVMIPELLLRDHFVYFSFVRLKVGNRVRHTS